MNNAVLLIEDDRVNNDLMSDFLEGEGYCVHTAVSADSAMKLMHKHHVDLVLTDIMMPGMSGMELLDTIKKDMPDLPIIVMTGYPSVEKAVRVMKDGAYDFLPKPFDLDYAAHMIRSAIEESRLKCSKVVRRESAQDSMQLYTVTRNLRQKINELSALYAISESLSHPTSMNDLFKRIVDITLSVVKCDNSCLWIPSYDGESIYPRCSGGGTEIKESNHCLRDIDLAYEAYSRKNMAISVDTNPCVCRSHGQGAHRTKHPCIYSPVIIGEDIFALIQVCGTIGGAPFSDIDMSLIRSLSEKAATRTENIALYENLTDRIIQSVDALMKAVDARDNYTMNHCRRVTSYALNLATELDCPEDILVALQVVGPLHDVGKIGVRDNILLKPGRLDREERKIMNSHVTIGEEIINPLGLSELEYTVVRNHHERFDGAGYPDRLKGEQIPYIVRLFSVADTYDAMTTSRPYKPARSHEVAVAELKRCRGQQFDGDIVDTFIRSGIMRSEIVAA